MKRVVYLLLMVVAPTFAQAEEGYKIKQIISTDSIVVVEVKPEDETPNGKTFLATFEDGKQCSLAVVNRNKNIIALDSSFCDRENQLRVNQSIEPALYVSAKAQKNEAKEAKPVVVQSSLDLEKRSVVDLGYLPPKGHFMGSASFVVSTSNSKLFSGATLVNETKSRGTVASLGLEYGLGQDLSFNIQGSYVPNSTTEYSASGNSNVSKGFEDPSLGIGYRLISQTEVTPFDVVLKFDFSPKTMKAKSATTGVDGTEGRGADQYSIGVGVYKKLEQVQLGFTLGYVGVSSGSKEDASSGTVTEFGTHDSTTLTGEAQFQINQSLFLVGGIGFMARSSEEQIDTSTSTVTKVNSFMTTALLGGARFMIVPDKAVLDLSIQVQSAEDIDASSGSTRLKIKEMKSTGVNFAVKYEF